ncbi:hypothetical protein FACS1894198_0750 [Clostridia bacterium]|nr:hypothetical protein FACS1894198_0750 [Clostridia bacterium]
MNGKKNLTLFFCSMMMLSSVVCTPIVAANPSEKVCKMIEELNLAKQQVDDILLEASIFLDENPVLLIPFGNDVFYCENSGTVARDHARALVNKIYKGRGRLCDAIWKCKLHIADNHEDFFALTNMKRSLAEWWSKFNEQSQQIAENAAKGSMLAIAIREQCKEIWRLGWKQVKTTSALTRSGKACVPIVAVRSVVFVQHGYALRQGHLERQGNAMKSKEDDDVKTLVEEDDDDNGETKDEKAEYMNYGWERYDENTRWR